MRTLIAVVLTLLLLTTAQAAPVTLAASDKDLGKTIGAYLKAAHQIAFESKLNEDKTTTLLRVEKAEGHADFPFLIVALPQLKDDNGKVTQQMVVLMVVSGLKVPDAKRAAVLEVMNRLNNDNDYTHLYIDDEGEVAFRWALVVTNDGLPAESVADAYRNMLPAWVAAAGELGKALQ